MTMNSRCKPDRITDFLDQRLTESDQLVLEEHLGECSMCRESLDAQTAEHGFWQKVGCHLQDDDELDVASDLHGGLVELNQQANIQHVLNALSPTDDPEMLGRIGSHEVSAVVGAGAMGIVLKGFDCSLDRAVAIKVLAPHLASSGAARKRFAREAQAAAAVLHPNVMAIHSVSNDESLPYLIMPYLRGTSLQKRLNGEGPLPVSEILRIGSQIAAGLAAAHAQGLVHRDVKPANILLEEGVERVAITDFGLARAVNDASLTCSGVVAGTPQYMSPEQARGESVDQRSDLFSLGAVLYALCVGHPPFRAESTFGVLRLITDKLPRPIQEINPDVPAWLSKIIAKLMEKQPENRFESASEVAKLLEDCLAHVQQPNVIPLPPQIDKLRSLGDEPPSHRYGTGILGFVAMLLLLAAGVIVLELNKGRLTIESDVDDVPVRIMQGDKLVEKLTVTRAGKSVRIAAGPYVVEIDGDLDGVLLDNGIVRLRRGGREVVKITRDDDVLAGEAPEAARLTDERSVYPRQRSLAAGAARETAANQMPTNPLSSEDQLSGYREFLWEALRAQQHKRNRLLSDITSCEQDIVALQQYLSGSDETDALAKETAERDRHVAQMAKLTKVIESLRPELDSVEQQIALLTKKLDGAQRASAKGTMAIEAQIVAVQDGHVHLSAGDNDGIVNRLKLTVFRNSGYVGQVEVVQTEADKSVARVLTQSMKAPIRPGDRATLPLDSPASKVVGTDLGEPIYNDRLKRFKFHLEKITVTSAAETAEFFMRQYDRRGYPQLTGVWGDPRTNSLIVVGPPEADQPIRNTIARWEGALLGIEMNHEDTLEAQREQLQYERRATLLEIASRKFKIIDAETVGEEPEQIAELNRQLAADTAQLKTIESKLKVIDDSLDRLNGTLGGADGKQVANTDKPPASFRDTIAGRWVIESCEISGKTCKPHTSQHDDPFAPPSEEPSKATREEANAQIALRDYAVAAFGERRVSLGPESASHVEPWAYDLEEQADPRRVTLTRGKEVIRGIIWARKSQLVLTLAIDHGDFPQGFDTEGTKHLTLRFARDETDPVWLMRGVDHLRRIGTELLLEGTASQQSTAREFLAMADSREREAKLREQARSAFDQAEALRKEQRFQEAKAQDQQADELRSQAEQERGEREHAARLRADDSRFREEIRQLNVRAAALRREGRFAEAEKLDREVQKMLRDQDPDLVRGNELKQRAAEARLEGRHRDADLFNRQADELLHKAKERYEHLDTGTSTTASDG